jgi:hypothetical protein
MSPNCQHRERVTYCAECEELLPPKLSTDGMMLSILRVLKAHGGTLDTLRAAVEGLPLGEAVVEAVAATPEPDEGVWRSERVADYLGMKASWVRDNRDLLGGFPLKPGTKKPRIGYPAARVKAYARGERPEAVSVERPKSNGRPWDGPLIEIKRKAPK